MWSNRSDVSTSRCQVYRVHYFYMAVMTRRRQTDRAGVYSSSLPPTRRIGHGHPVATHTIVITISYYCIRIKCLMTIQYCRVQICCYSGTPYWWLNRQRRRSRVFTHFILVARTAVDDGTAVAWCRGKIRPTCSGNDVFSGPLSYLIIRTDGNRFWAELRDSKVVSVPLRQFVIQLETARRDGRKVLQGVRHARVR